MSQLLSLDFWSLVGAVSGIYAIFALGLQLQFGFTGLLNFGHVASMAIGAYTMAILVVKEHVPLWGASLVAIAAGMLFGAALSLPTLRLRADYFAITTIAISETVRYFALNEQSLTGGALGTSNLAGPTQVTEYNADWVSFQASVQSWLHHLVGRYSEIDFAMLVIVWVVVLLCLLVLYADGALAVGPRPAGDPRGRGRGRGARQAGRAGTSSSRSRSGPASVRSRACSTRSSSSSSARTTSTP